MDRTAKRWIEKGAPYVAGAALTAAAFITYRAVAKRVKAAKSAGPMTPATTDVHAADSPIGPAGRNEDDRLDEALQESFPTSDPVSIQIT
jgi:hypothetical protein